jgi:hypothetical protein
MLGIITTMHSACGGEGDGGGVLLAVMNRSVARQLNNGSPRACNKKVG